MSHEYHPLLREALAVECDPQAKLLALRFYRMYTLSKGFETGAPLSLFSEDLQEVFRGKLPPVGTRSILIKQTNSVLSVFCRLRVMVCHDGNILSWVLVNVPDTDIMDSDSRDHMLAASCADDNDNREFLNAYLFR